MVKKNDFFLNVEKFMEAQNDEFFKILVNGASQDFKAYLTNEAFDKTEDNIIVLCKNAYYAKEMYDVLIQNEKIEDDIYLFLADDFHSADFVMSSNDYTYLRIKALMALLENKKNIIVTHTTAYLRRNMSSERLKRSIITLKKGDIFDKSLLEKTLMRYGYNKNFQVEKRADFASKGYIVDFYGLDDNPVRIYFFDNEIEDIKYFDLDKQRTIESIDQIQIHPLLDFYFFEDEEEYIKELSKGTDDFENLDLIKLEKHLLKFDNANLSNFESSILYIDNFKAIEECVVAYNEELTELILEGENLQNDLLDLYELITNEKRTVYFNNELDSITSYDNVFSFNTTPLITYNSNLTVLKEDITNKNKTFYLEKSKTVLRTLEHLEIEPNYLDSFEDAVKGKANIINKAYDLSFYFGNECYYISKKLIYKDYKKKRADLKIKEAKKISSLDEIMYGDFVVHVDYGIGKYCGIKPITLNNITNDYIYIEYKDNEILYVPVDKFDLIMKYSSSDSFIPVVNSLNSTSWAKTKAKARKRIKELAFNLVQVYQERSKANGYSCTADEPEQLLFENDFDHIFTSDQEKSLVEIKNDMESKKPMDRLLCGDVGFGKTEVAMRAAFKMCTNLKQTAYLCPTTILANQHYQNYKERFLKYGFKIALINRFVSVKRQNEIMKGLESGEIDIVIGTHRLLNKKFKYKDLGLLVIDEEQRFGVNQKEKIRSIKMNVDTISLSATPIPRTLQMSIMGIKDVSLINTPPINRYPIQTYVLKNNDIVLRNAIERELARNGQIFYLHNNISQLEEKAFKLKKLIPDAKIAVAHGALDKNSLEDIIQRFIDKEFNILVCTTIIETGIDISNANTLIIDGAEKFGLSQLYQIRGRVGRSDKLAYCYLMTSKTFLSDVQDKRLNTIKEFTSLGSGVKVANRDLAIRGAGDVFGAEQSGFVNDVGIDLFMKILEEEVLIAKGEDVIPEKTIPQRVLGNKHIPDEYISDDPIKIKMHKEIYKLDTVDDYYQLRKEYLDLYGKIDDETDDFMKRTLLNKTLDNFKGKANNSGYQFFEVTLSKETTALIDGLLLMETAYKHSKTVKLSVSNKQIVIAIDKLANKDYYMLLVKILEDYINEVSKNARTE